ncbi:DUF6493 family protein [Actinocrinis sp.]|uniref:DUF7824 domain-containing protein n=1 Tax=Actinocrinis sp. TaxID=1920516 RepID=UPI002D251DE1|nr:DUF6493 family protein [Actinocrinis sp.]HZP51373.1 DUF6493 family protein [Actinocrinis sp.]
MAWGAAEARTFGESAARVEWSELRALIAGRVPERVLRRLAYTPADELAHLRPHLKALRTQLRTALKTTDRAAHDEAYAQLAPLYLAGVLCSADPAEALDWLTSPVLRDAAWQRPDGSSREPSMRRVLLSLLLDHRDGAWQRDLAGRLAQWLPAAGDPRRWALTDGLAAWSGAKPPLTDGYVLGWVLRGSSVSRDHARGRLDVREWFAELGWRPPVRHHATLLDWLRAQPRLTEIVPRLFEVAEVGTHLDDAEPEDAGGGEKRPADAAPDQSRAPENEWAGALATLAAEGVLDRGELLDLCLAKLLRGDRPGNLRGFVLLAERLAPRADEVSARLATFVALAGRGAGPSARLAQGALRDLDAAGRLGSVTLAEVSKTVLGRPERNLVTTQLSWVEAAVRRDRGCAPELLNAVSAAFAHPAVPVQERALRIVVRYLKHLDADEVAQLHDAALKLDAVLRDEALRVLGGDPDGTGSSSQTSPRLLPAYQPLAAPEPVRSTWELVELLGSVLADGAAQASAQDIERILDGAVAEYDRDALALAEALAPLAARFPATGLDPWEQRGLAGALRCLLYALLGEDRRAVVVMDELYGVSQSGSVAPDRAVLYRVYELVENLGRVRIPGLLATPTHGDGSIDPEVLRFRLDRYERSSAAPLPCDLEQALLRVPVEDAQTLLASSALLATPAGKELAALFAWGEGALPFFERFVIRRSGAAQDGPAGTRTGVVQVPRIAPRFSAFHELIGAVDRQPSPVTVLARIPDPDDVNLFAWNGSSTHAALWPSLLPFHPEVVAAHAIPVLYQQANDTARDRNALLPVLAGTAGWPGPVTHLALAYGLAAGRPENRAAAVEAMVTFAARTLLDARALGALCGELWASRMIKPNRLVHALDGAAQAGARREVFSVAAAALPALTSQPSVRGLADLLVLAADCARVADLREEIPELGALIALEKPSRVATEARRLRRILGR